MNNIHTLAEYRDDYAENIPFNTTLDYYDSQSSFVQRSKPIDVVNLIFPHFTWKSFFIVISIIQIIIFITLIIIKPAEFLTPSVSLLITVGANDASKIKKGEIHRLLLPIFFHANIFHIFFNVFFQLRMGFTLEKNYGVLKIIILYFVTGIYGNILSASITYCSIKVGASTSGMGLVGIVISELILLWNVIRHRERVLFNIIFLSLMTLFYYFTFNGSNIDHIGHIGGLLSGICIGILYNGYLENKPVWYKYARIGSYICLSLLLIVPTIILFSIHRTC